MGDRQYQQHNRSFRGGHGRGGGGHGGAGYDEHGHHHGGGHRGGGRGGRGGGGWQGGEGRGGGRGGYGRGGGGGGYGGHGGGPHGMEGGRGGGGGGGGYQRSYIGGKRGREDGPEGQPPKLSPQHVLVAKLLGVCDRNTGSGRDNWTDERFFDDLLKSCRRDLEHGGDNVASILVEAAVEVSFKTQHYALVLGILNTERPDFARRIASAVISDLRDCLAAPEPRSYRAKQLLRFLAALHAVSVIPASWLLAALAGLVQAASGALAQATAAEHGHGAAGADDVDGEMAGGGGGGGSAAAAAVQPWSDYLVYAALAALPWCGRDLAAEESVGGGADGGGGGGLSLAGLLAMVESYMAARPVCVDEALRPMSGSRSEEDMAAKSDSGGASFLGELWSAITECRDNAWEVQVLPGPHVPYLEKLAQAEPLEGLEPLEVPTWPSGVEPSEPPAVMAARIRRLFPARGGIRLLSREYLEGELPAVERVVVEEYVLDTLVALSSERTACVLTLSGALPHHLASVFGPQRATVRNFVAEALFGQMLRLPAPALSHAAYCTVLVDLCKVPHFQFARALSSCVRELFGCMPYLDPELRFRLASWLSYHLSSFGYQWPWDRWQWVSERPAHDPQRGFCVLLLHRLLRLADYPVVKQSLPPYFQALLGPPPALAGPPLPGNLAHHQPAHMQPPKDPQQQQAAAAAARRRGGGGSRRDEADPDLLEDEQVTEQQQAAAAAAAAAAGGGGGGAAAMQVDAEEPQQGQGQREGGGEEADGGQGQREAAPAAPWSGDPVAEAAARLVVWCRQEGSAVAATTKARSLRPEQVAALWSGKVVNWMHENCGPLMEQQGPLAGPKVLATLILAMGVKSPSHLHVAVERYAEAIRSGLAEADADAGALGALPAGSWEATAAALGASPGQMAMVQVARHYHQGEPQRLLLVVDRLLALHVLEGPGLVAALFADTKQPGAAAGGGSAGAEGEGEGAAERQEEQEEGGPAACTLSCFHDPVLCAGSWEVLLHGMDRLMRMPVELPAEVEAWEKKMAHLESIHSGVVQSVAAGAPGLVQRERDVAAQVEQASRCVEMVRGRLERSSALAQDALLLMYLGFARLLNRAAAQAEAAMDDEATTRAEAAVSLLGGWLRAVLRRYAEPSAALVGSGRLREELAAHEVALGGPPPEPFRQAVAMQLGGLRV
ncbi:hypothetical protein PLESTB_000866500 [Pleodorina starrii]|uniref:MIF4G-like type 1 domain-containing protein n=1 Tax=Pleodorina starrii TaxID=330485 RepID=A0A9W6F357_9CHLO|nr:hypothetical protein PLESTM_001427300 [Pleodorina starrii]GLC54464.1 hypothetical protein PLESTB_000866500 [Pleodorina starrii]GLC72116.1 hypothetical protein PLESTF_001205600 [Pleodorina starrii]